MLQLRGADVSKYEKYSLKKLILCLKIAQLQYQMNLTLDIIINSKDDNIYVKYLLNGKKE